MVIQDTVTGTINKAIQDKTLPSFFGDGATGKMLAIAYKVYPAPPFGDCVAYKEQLDLMDIDMEEGRKKVLSSSKSYYYKKALESLNKIRETRENEFYDLNCDVVLSGVKTKMTAEIIGGELSKYNKELDASTKNQQNRLLLIGSGVIILGLIAILAFRKK